VPVSGIHVRSQRGRRRRGDVVERVHVDVERNDEHQQYEHIEQRDGRIDDLQHVEQLQRNGVRVGRLLGSCVCE
jgi:hypothetical protein